MAAKEQLNKDLQNFADKLKLAAELQAQAMILMAKEFTKARAMVMDWLAEDSTSEVAHQKISNWIEENLRKPDDQFFFLPG